MLRTVLMPQGSPKGAIEEMRKAFAAVGRDKEFQNDYQKIIKVNAEIISVEDGEAAVSGVAKIKPAMIELLKGLAQWN